MSVGIDPPPSKKEISTCKRDTEGWGQHFGNIARTQMEGGGSMRKRKVVTDLEANPQYMIIRDSLLEQLEINHIDTEYNKDLIGDYMDFWITKCLLIADIKSRGVTVTYNNGGGQRGKKKNESVIDVTKINTQMLKILDNLGLKPTASLDTNGMIDNDPL